MYINLRDKSHKTVEHTQVNLFNSVTIGLGKGCKICHEKCDR